MESHIDQEYKRYSVYSWKTLLQLIEGSAILLIEHHSWHPIESLRIPFRTTCYSYYYYYCCYSHSEGYYCYLTFLKSSLKSNVIVVVAAAMDIATIDQASILLQSYQAADFHLLSVMFVPW